MSSRDVSTDSGAETDVDGLEVDQIVTGDLLPAAEAADVEPEAQECSEPAAIAPGEPEAVAPRGGLPPVQANIMARLWRAVACTRRATDAAAHASRLSQHGSMRAMAAMQAFYAAKADYEARARAAVAVAGAALCAGRRAVTRVRFRRRR